MEENNATQAQDQEPAHVKPEVKPDVQHLTLTVANQDGSRVPFKVKMTTAFEKLFKAYCSKKALDASTLVFITSEGQRILGHQTPADFNMEDGDQIEVQQHQIGGC
ncbi:hypothetical protein WJX75_001471 [Coccomyxa subellipsoidea]|uniref:Ubiquitin-like domain-containing protein n=1 Tax=Coccomyxa subellipsoidea TaxID=248742 RepID=A0ABR2YFW5_9CHLO